VRERAGALGEVSGAARSRLKPQNPAQAAEDRFWSRLLTVRLPRLCGPFPKFGPC